MRGILLSRHLLWATFDREDEEKDPCARLLKQGTTICACLALDERTVGDDLLGVRYRLAHGEQAYFPTVASAACSKPWNECWEQAPEGAEHGWTVPRPSGYACPEVVHRTVDGAQMVLPLRRYAP